MDITIHFTDDDIEWMCEKFEIITEEDLKDAVLECINTYMEM